MFNPFETTPAKPATKKVDANKPLAPQLAGDQRTQPIQFAPQPYPAQPAFGTQPAYAAPQMQISPADQQKWMDFLTNIYTKARQANTLFDDFETQVESITESVPGMPIAQQIQAVYGILKKKGATKASILDAANAVLKAVNDSVPAFQNTQVEKTKKGVTDLQQQITDKQNQIAQLQQDIAQLNQNINDNQVAIATREYGFNACFSQVIAKVTNDVNNINNYIAG